MYEPDPQPDIKQTMTDVQDVLLLKGYTLDRMQAERSKNPDA